MTRVTYGDFCCKQTCPLRINKKFQVFKNSLVTSKRAYFQSCGLLKWCNIFLHNGDINKLTHKNLDFFIIRHRDNIKET